MSALYLLEPMFTQILYSVVVSKLVSGKANFSIAKIWQIKKKGMAS